MNISIRSIEPQDYEQLVDLFHEFALFEKMPDKMTNSKEQMLHEQEFFHGFVAETSDRQIVGYVTYFFGYYTWIGKSLYMDDLYVKPEFRGQGVGTKLIHQLIELAKELKCHKMRWQVSGWNTPAMEFYKSLGATIDGTEHNCDLVFD